MPAQRGRARAFVIGARRAVAPARPLRGAPAGGGTGSGPSATAGTPPSEKVKMSALVDPSADAEVDIFSPAKVTQIFKEYAEEKGDHPQKKSEPTAEQLSAVHQLIRSDAPSYAHLFIFGPHGCRLLRKLTFVVAVYQPESDTWNKLELPEPPSFEVWWR